MTLPPAGPPLTHAIGRVEDPPTYYEVLTPLAGSTKPPVVMIHGGAPVAPAISPRRTAGRIQG